MTSHVGESSHQKKHLSHTVVAIFCSELALYFLLVVFFRIVAKQRNKSSNENDTSAAPKTEAILSTQNDEEIDFRSASRIKQLNKLEKMPKFNIKEEEFDKDEFENFCLTISEGSSSDE